MKKVLLIAAVLGFTSLGYKAVAQEEKVEIKEQKEKKEVKERKEKKETQEIIIRKKGDKDTKVTVEIKGDVITINGKPLDEFKDGDITINKRDIRIFDGQHNFTVVPDDMEMYFNGPLNGNIASRPGKPRAFLGVTTSTDNNNDKKSDGAVITAVTDGSAAEKAGLKEGDIITKINDKKVEGPGSIAEVIGSFKPKDEVTVYYKRDGKEKSAKAVLGETKSNMNLSYSFSGPRGNLRTVPGVPMPPPSAYTIPRVPEWNSEGFDQLEKLNNLKSIEGFSLFPRQQKLGLKIQDTEEGDGVKVLDTDKDSPAEKAGLKKDDIVTEIGGVKVSNTDDARDQLQENAEKSSYTIKAKRNGTEMSFNIKIPKKLKTADL
jgi:serine protease Do